MIQIADTPRQAEPVWLSGHLHFDFGLYGDPADRLLLNVVRPFAEQTLSELSVDNFFFIRYAQNGPHIRVRVRGEASILETRVRPALVRCGGDALRWVTYEPELERYGGPQAMRVAQDLFQASSLAAFELIEASLAQPSSRLAKGLLAMIAFLFAFHPDRASATTFVRRYCDVYLTTVARQEGQREPIRDAFNAAYDKQATVLEAAIREAWDRLSDGVSLSPALDRYLQRLLKTRSDLEPLCAAGLLATSAGPITTMDQAAHWIGASYVHMMNNRLGIPVTAEAYLAHLIARVFASPSLQPIP